MNTKGPSIHHHIFGWVGEGGLANYETRKITCCIFVVVVVGVSGPTADVETKRWPAAEAREAGGMINSDGGRRF